jgi:hypothetical protein
VAAGRRVVTTMLDSFWRAERRRLITELTQANAVTLSATETDNAVTVLDEALAFDQTRIAVRIDIGHLVSPHLVALEIARRTGSVLAGGEDLFVIPAQSRTPEQTVDLLEIRRTLGQAALALDGEEADDAVVVSSALEALEHHAAGVGLRPVLALIGPERALIDSKLGDLLWSMRGTAQRLPQLVVVLCGGPGVPELTSDKRRAFYGWGTEITLGSPDLNLLSAEIERRLRTVQMLESAEQSAAHIAELSQGSISTAEQLTERLITRILERQAVDVPTVWQELLAVQRPRLRTLAAATASLHTLAIPICTTIATYQSPYQTAVGYPSTISRAIIALRAAGIIDRRGPRSWRIVDPLFQTWLAS